MNAHDAAESKVTRGGVHHLRHPSGRPIATAVIRGTEVRPALHDLAGDPDLRGSGIVAVLTSATTRVGDRAAGSFDLAVILEPVGRPLPHVTVHIEQAVPIRRKRADGRCPLVAVFDEVLPGELTLPGVRHWSAVRHVLVTPREFRLFEPAARGDFPLRLSR